MLGGQHSSFPVNDCLYIGVKVLTFRKTILLRDFLYFLRTNRITVRSN